MSCCLCFVMPELAMYRLLRPQNERCLYWQFVKLGFSSQLVFFDNSFQHISCHDALLWEIPPNSLPFPIRGLVILTIGTCSVIFVMELIPVFLNADVFWYCMALAVGSFVGRLLFRRWRRHEIPRISLYQIDYILFLPQNLQQKVIDPRTSLNSTNRRSYPHLPVNPMVALQRFFCQTDFERIIAYTFESQKNQSTERG